MKTVIKYAAVGIVGYLVGFYEMKYKVMKVLLMNQTKEEKEEA